MVKFTKQSAYCMVCDWEIKGTHKCLDGIQCPKCKGPVMTEERK